MKQVGTILALALALAAVACRADRIVFKNGRSLECTILAEGADHVEISIGGGQMNIPRSQLEKVIKTGTAAPAPKQQASLSGLLNTVPPEHAEIAAKFRQLLQLRNSAADAQYMIGEHEKQITNLDNKRLAMVAESTELARRIEEKSQQMAAVKLPEKTADTKQSTLLYNQQVTELRRLGGQYDALLARMSKLAEENRAMLSQQEQLRQQIKSQHEPVMLYRQELPRFAESFASHKSQFPQPDDDTEVLFVMIDRQLLRFRQEMPANMIDVRRKGNSTIVRALVNDTLSGEFVLDTGAEIMTISEEFALKLGMRLEDLPISDGILADGSVIDIRQATLQSVAVGDAKVEGVRCGVVAKGVNGEVDGLLGMSFLKHFSVHHNIANGELVFSRFSPQE